jgi:hypothetical protein
MEYFDRMGDRIFGLWQERNLDEHTLPSIAERVLVDDPAHRQLSALEPLLWLQGRKSIPEQLDFPGTFGQPPLTIYRRGPLVIDVYYWMDGTTAVHQHAFSGAFQVLSGSSIHTEYGFVSDERIHSRMHLGKLSHKKSECLNVGATRQIRSGDQFIHALFHLDRPSVTVVVRCTNQTDVLPQFSYHRPHVAIDVPARSDALFTRQVQALHVLKETDLAAFDGMVASIGEEVDFHNFYLLLREYSRLQGDFALIEEKLQLGRKRHGARIDLLRPVLREELRQGAIISRRRHVRNKDHRFFLALLANATSRGMLLDLVAQRDADCDPVDRVMDWIRELVASKSSVSESEPNAIGLPLDDEMLLLMSLLLRGSSAEQIRSHLVRGGYDPEGLDRQIASFMEAMNGSYLMSILFSESAERAA